MVLRHRPGDRLAAGQPDHMERRVRGNGLPGQGNRRRRRRAEPVRGHPFSPLTGQDDVPENHHTLVYALDGDEDGTKVTITQDNNGDQAEADRNAETWGQMLEGLKKHLAGG